MVFIETKGLGHSMHDDELYNKVSRFYLLKKNNFLDDTNFCIKFRR
jgi:hypothetical protein